MDISGPDITCQRIISIGVEQDNIGGTLCGQIGYTIFVAKSATAKY